MFTSVHVRVYVRVFASMFVRTLIVHLNDELFGPSCDLSCVLFSFLQHFNSEKSGQSLL